MKKFLPLNRFFLFSSLLLTSFFLLSSNVKAEEIVLNISDFYFNFDSNVSNYEGLRSKVSEYMQQHSNYPYYFCYYDTDTSTYSVNLNSIRCRVYQNNNVQLGAVSSSYLLRYNFSPSGTYNFVNTSSSSNISGPSSYSLWNLNFIQSGDYSTYSVIDTNMNLVNISNNIYVFNSSYGSISVGNGDSFPTLSYLKSISISEPVDNTPVLTNFYSVVSSKIIFLAESVISNYVLLSIFVILILIFLIELIRRYLL